MAVPTVMRIFQYHFDRKTVDFSLNIHVTQRTMGIFNKLSHARLLNVPNYICYLEKILCIWYNFLKILRKKTHKGWVR